MKSGQILSVLLGLLSIGAATLLSSSCADQRSSKEQKTEPIKISPSTTFRTAVDQRRGISKTYYRQLNKMCQDRKSVSCCQSSVSRMQRGNFIMAPETGCPEGTFRNRLKCVDSLTWCEPIKTNTPDKIYLKSSEPQSDVNENKKSQ